MPRLTLSSIDRRVKIEAKDPIDQFPVQRRDYIRDTCIEITTTQDYEWLYESKTFTVPTPNDDWFNIQTGGDYPHQITVVKTVTGNKTFKYIAERDFIEDYYQTVNGGQGRFRLRWNENTQMLQMALINPPEVGSSILVLFKKYLAGPEKFPPFMEEVLVRGAVSRFQAFLEGDDLEVARENRAKFLELAQQQYWYGNSHLNDQPHVAKTNKEIYDAESYNSYNSYLEGG